MTQLTTNPDTGAARRAAIAPERHRIRVLYIDHTAILGGGEIALLNVVRKLDLDRFEPEVLFFSEGPLIRRIRDEGIVVHILPLAPTVANANKDLLGLRSILRIRDVFRTLRHVRTVMKFIRDGNYDIVHTNSLKSDVIGGLAARLARKPVIWHIRDRIAEDYLPHPVVMIFRRLCRIVPTHIIANSRATLATVQRGRAESVVSSGVDLKSRTTVVHDGTQQIDTTHAGNGPQSAPRIALIGRISPWKGQDVFIRAAAIVHRTFPGAKFLIVGTALFGEDKYAAKIHRLVEELGLQQAVEFTGFREDVPALLRSLTMVVHASTTGEPFGQVIIEAMAAEKPVIATRGGGVLEIVVEGETGLLVPMGSDTDLAAAMIRLLNSPEEAKAMGRRGHLRVEEHFTIESTIKKIMAIYDHLLKASMNNESKDSGLPGLIFISMQDWDDIWRRNQFVCAELARRHPRMKILFVSTPRNAWHLLVRGDVATLLGLPMIAAPGYPNITIAQCPKVAPDRYGWGRWLNEAVARRHVRKIARRLGMKRPILWLNPHSAVHMVGKMSESSVVYDITDDWISFQKTPEMTEKVRRQDRELCGKADAVIVCSDRLQEIKQEIARDKLHLIPNGVNAEHYRVVLEGTGPLPPTAAAWPKPVFGYTGTIHPDRVDVELIEAVAKRLTSGTMVFMGPDHFSPAIWQRLMATGRVVFHEPVSYEMIPQYMRAFDVCITPHRKSDFVESLQPIKLWEYLAAGKPIVATNVAGFRDFPHLVRIAEGAEQFAEQLTAAAAEGPALAAQRQAVARENSWNSRVDAIERVFEKLCAPPQKRDTGQRRDIAHV